MRYKNLLSVCQCLFCLGYAIFCLSPSADANERSSGELITQKNAQTISGKNMERGSDDSIDECTQHAMSAVMNFASLNIGGAVAEGYHAVGNYLNSDKMDKIQAQNNRLESSLASIGSVSADGRTSSGKSGASGQSAVSGRRLSERDTYFLYRGKTSEVAAEFEKKTGMKRDTFFSHMAAGIDAKFSFDDPDLLSKLEARYDSFKSAITNEEFKGRLNAAERLIPADGKAKGLAALKEFVEREAPDSTGDVREVASIPTIPGGDEVRKLETPFPPGGEQSIVLQSPEVADGLPTPRAFQKFDSLRSENRALINIKTEGGLADYFQSSSNDRSRETSLFEQVSRRYRLLSVDF